jgi:hypothetical protein
LIIVDVWCAIHISQLCLSGFAEQKEHQNLIPSVRKSSATVLKFQGGNLVSSQHRRKLRCLELCPVNDQLVVTRYYNSWDIINTSK